MIESDRRQVGSVELRAPAGAYSDGSSTGLGAAVRHNMNAMSMIKSPVSILVVTLSALTPCSAQKSHASSRRAAPADTVPTAGRTSYPRGLPAERSSLSRTFAERILSWGASAGPCTPGDRARPTSLLLYPEFDNRTANTTLLTVTNTNPTDGTWVEFVYIGRFGGPATTDVANGGFGNGLDSWQTSVSDFQWRGIAGSVVVDNGQALIREGSSFLTTLSTSFTMPVNATTLSFDCIFDPGFDLDANFIPDAFEAQFLDDFDNPLVTPFTAGATSFWNVQEDGSVAQGPQSTWNGLTCTLNVAGIAPGTHVNLYFDYIGADFDFDGGVRIDNVRLTGGVSTDLACLEFNRSHYLTPLDTLSVVTRAHNPSTEQGYCYVFAKNAAGQATSFNHLIGTSLAIQAIDSSSYGINAVGFRSLAGPGQVTDVDGDDHRDLNGIEYEPAPGEILIPRFLGQRSADEGQLILLGLSGGTQFTTTVDFTVFNDNEEPFSAQRSFRCWDKLPLLGVSTVFSNDWLSGTSQSPGESVGMRETGWMRIVGALASSTITTIDDPAIYAVYIERLAGGRAVADLPFEVCSRSGHLLPNGPLGDNEE